MTDFLALTLSASSTRGSSSSPGLLIASPNQLQISLPSTIDVSQFEVSLDSISLPYSWPNISLATYGPGSNAFAYIFNGTSYPVTLPDGYYSVSDINSFLQAVMLANGHFLVLTDAAGITSPQFFLSLLPNATYATTTLSATPIPSTLPPNTTNPNNLTLSGLSPQIVLQSGTLSQILGFVAGTYPATPSATPFQLNGSSTGSPSPSNPTQLITVNCSVVAQSQYNTFPNSIFTIVPSAYAHGSTINIITPKHTYYPCGIFASNEQHQCNAL